MKITIEVELGNDAMLTPADVSHSLQKSLARGGGSTMFEPLAAGDSNVVLDGNGNTVGRWTVEPRTTS